MMMMINHLVYYTKDVNKSFHYYLLFKLIQYFRVPVIEVEHFKAYFMKTCVH